MIAKFGFVLLVLVFGGLMFLAGVLAPNEWRRNIEAWLQPVAARLDAAPVAAPSNAISKPASAANPK